MWVWIGVQDVHRLHRHYAASGAKIRNLPENFEWALEMQVEDLDGNVLPHRLRSGEGQAARRVARWRRDSLETSGQSMV
jgi:hypothetical protein